MGNMDSAARPLGPAALGTVLGLLSVTELAIRLTSKSTVHAGLAAGPPAHAGISLPTALLMGAFCLLATVPAGWLRPLPAALAVYAAALVSLALFELVTIAGAAALLVTAYRLARGGSVVLAVALAAPFLGLALVLAGPAPRPDTVPIATNASGLWAAGADTRVLAMLLAVAIPVAAVTALARGAREQTETHSAVRELSEGMLADHLARGERARIARELHDVVAHHISMIAVQAETARLTTPGLPAAGAQRFATIGDTARAGLTEMRRLLGVLREDAGQGKETGPDLEPAALERPGAGRAAAGRPGAGRAAAGRPGADRRPQPGLPQLGDLVDGAREASGSVVRLIMSGSVTRLDPGVELAAYRIVQEALTNTRRHAPGAAVDVELRYAEDALRLRIRDNGPGQAARSHTGHGLLGMRERAAAVGGALQAGDARGGGFCVEAELPARAPDAMTGAAGRMHQ
jgi:signal transduction histidine kinase